MQTLKIDLDLTNTEDITQVIDIHNKLVDGKIIVTKIKRTYKSGVLVEEMYANNENRVHRDANSYGGEGPAIICYNKDKLITEESWYLKGKLHRDDDLPAQIYYSDNGKLIIKKVRCVNNGSQRNNDLPTTEMYHNVTGRLYYQDWRVNYSLHRDPAKGPAVILYDNDGHIQETKYYNRGVRIVSPKFDELKKLIKELNDREIDAIIKVINTFKK